MLIGVNPLRADLQNVSDKVTNTETNIKTLQREVANLKRQMAAMSTTVVELGRRAEDTASRSRRKNVWVLGFPEKVECLSNEFFLENRIRSVLYPQGLSDIFVMEPAHRAFEGAPQGHLTKVLNYRDRDCILRTAREQEVPHYESFVITIFPDYTKFVQEQRKSFIAAKQKLRVMA
ncbi:hypothetical protein NDU88_004280 [Pleurodeles waltl]|uniref:Uncharacterized protein n=1 Tax=Pleurodeles waltl TaxID=8319 RepID=A0AAV7KZI1_PLEWA|nr:hypothetical protein NDU88_004280 [Pleurodeles waltl]